MEKKCWREVKVPVNGVELYCIISGDGPTPVLFLTGAATPTVLGFPLQLEYFGRNGSGFTVISFDPRGYGYSHEVPRTFSVVPEHHTKIDAKDAYEIMKHLGYKKYLVVGWCDGGLTAIYLAALFPDAVQGMITWGSRIHYSERDVAVSESMRDIIKGLSAHPELCKKFIEVYGSESTLQNLWDKFTDSVLETYEYVKDKNGMLCADELSQIKCPTIILHGENDHMTTLDQAQLVKDLIPGGQLVLIEEGVHYIQMKTPDKFNDAVDGYLKEMVANKEK